MFWPIISFTLLVIPLVFSQGIRSNLFMCYNDTAIPGITEANNRPPSSINVLIELLRRIEDANPTLSTRDISVLILKQLLQSGIVYNGQATPYQLPYFPDGFDASKSKLILDGYLTNSSSTFNFGDLDNREICTLHYIISSSIEFRIRGDESTTCKAAARYTLRMKRAVNQTIENSTVAAIAPRRQNPDVESVEGFGVRMMPAASERSQCPIELGVVDTNYGAVKAGLVLSGIATGLNPEPVAQSDNRYAATVAGELCEAALFQIPPNKIGNEGYWNDTLVPKYYFLDQNQYFQMTDAEVRGSLDGLYMALKIDSWKQKSDIKMSQIIDMYYSPYQKGVFDPALKACNRNLLFTEIVDSQTLKDQIRYFMIDFGSRSTSTNPDAFAVLANNIYDTFSTYFTQSYQSDLACKKQEPIQRVVTDLLIFLDAGWDYKTVQPVLNYILDNIDVNKFHSQYTIINGVIGANITNSSRYLLDYYKKFNSTTYNTVMGQIDYTKVYQTIEDIVISKLNNNSYAAGESTIVLIVTKTKPSDSTVSFLEQRKKIMTESSPDVTVLVMGQGSQTDYNSMLVNPAKDFILLSDTTNSNDLTIVGNNVVERIKQVPRAIVNPKCGSSFSGGTSSFSLTQYVELNGVNYYRISPNYFYTGSDDMTLKVTENGYGTIEVCTSREQSAPNNATSQCQVLSSAVKTINLHGYCEETVSNCAPIFLAVSGFVSKTQCKDAGCRFPDEIKYTISMDNVGCYSGTISIYANTLLIVLLIAAKLGIF